MAYTPKPPVTITTFEDLRQWVDDELHQIARQEGEGREDLRLRVLYAEPRRPRDGMIVYADGTTWDPGGGVGIYGRIAGAWVKL